MRRRSLLLLAFLLHPLALLLLLPATASGRPGERSSDCTPGWSTTLGQLPGTDAPIEAMEVFDDGNGEALYVATTISSVGAFGIAKWDGIVWSPLGEGVFGPVVA